MIQLHLFGALCTDLPEVQSYTQVMNCNVDRFKLFFHSMLEQSAYLAPSAFEAGFVSAAHSKADIDVTLNAAERVLAGL